MKKYFFLDVANTLLHKPTVYTQWLAVLEDFGYTINPEVFRKHHKLVSEIIEFPDKTSQAFYKDFNARVLIALGIEPTTQLLDVLFSKLSYTAWEIFEDVSFLKSFDCPIGIISNWDRSLPEKLANFNLDFDLIVGSEDVGFKKPDVRIFQYALDQLTESYDEVYFVGDSIKLDILPANAAGLIPILIDRYNDYPYFKGKKIASFQDLMSIA